MTAEQHLRLPSQRIARRTVFIWAAESAIWMVVRCAIVAAIMYFIPQDSVPAALQQPQSFGWIAVPVVWGLLEIFVWPQIMYTVHRWEVTDDAVYTRVGLFSTTTTIVPINRLQNVEMGQSAFQRIAGLAHVVCTSAGDTVTIGTIDRDLADQLTKQLVATISADEGDAT